MWEYDPSGDEWEQLPDFQGYSRRWAICFAVNNKAYRYMRLGRTFKLLILLALAHSLPFFL